MLTLWLYAESIPKLILIRRLRCFAHRFQGPDEGSGEAEEPLKFVCASIAALATICSLFFMFLNYSVSLHILPFVPPDPWLSPPPKPDSWWGVQSNFLRPFLCSRSGFELKYLHSSWYDREQSWENLTLLKGWWDQKKIVWWEILKCRLISCS